MKRTFTMALSMVLLAGGIVGCSKNDLVEPVVAGKELGFTTYVGGNTKGLAKTEFVVGDKFAVMATESPVPWASTDNVWFMGGGTDAFVVVTNTQSADQLAWKYSPIKLWPEANKVSFFAFSPVPTADNGITNVKAEEGTPTLEFTVNNEIKSQIDLLRAESLDKFNEDIELPFGHALSRISFAARASVTKSQRVRLDKITLKNIKNTGKLNIYDVNRQIGSIDDMGGWTAQTGAVDFSPALTHEVASLVPETLVPMAQEDQSLFMIPQEFQDGNGSVLEVTYSYSNDGGKKWVNNAVFEIDLATYTRYWNPGKSYRYVLTLAPEKIYDFAATIVDWDDELDIEATNPISVKQVDVDPTGTVPAAFTVIETTGTNLGYTLKAVEDWIKISDVNTGANPVTEITYNPDGTITKAYEKEKNWYVVLAVNNTGAVREGSVELIREGFEKVVLKVVQNGLNPFMNCPAINKDCNGEVYEVTGLVVPTIPGYTYALRAEDTWFTLSADGQGAGTNKLAVTGDSADPDKAQSFFIHMKPNIATSDISSKISFVAVNTIVSSEENVTATMIVKQKAQSNPFLGAADLNPTAGAAKLLVSSDEGLKIANGAEFTVTSDDPEIKFSFDDEVEADAATSKTLLSTGAHKLYAHYPIRKNVAPRVVNIKMTFTDDATIVHEHIIKQQGHADPFSTVSGIPTTYHYSNSKHKLTRLSTIKDVEYTISSTTGAKFSLDGGLTPVTSLKFTATAALSEFYVHIDENPSESAARSISMSIDVPGATTKTVYNQPYRIGTRAGHFGGTVKKETIGNEEHAYFSKTIYIATSSVSGTTSWYGNTTTTTGATDYWDGLSNITRLGSASSAANACKNQGNNYFLPAYNQLLSVWVVQSAITISSDGYWCSTESNATSSWVVSFNDGATYPYTKTESNSIRCVREITN